MSTSWDMNNDPGREAALKSYVVHLGTNTQITEVEVYGGDEEQQQAVKEAFVRAGIYYIALPEDDITWVYLHHASIYSNANHVAPGWSLALAAHLRHERSGEPVTTVEVYEGTPQQQKLVQEQLSPGIYYIDTHHGETVIYQYSKFRTNSKVSVKVGLFTPEGLFVPIE